MIFLFVMPITITGVHVSADSFETAMATFEKQTSEEVMRELIQRTEVNGDDQKVLDEEEDHTILTPAPANSKAKSQVRLVSKSSSFEVLSKYFST